MKSHKIANNAATTVAREKISANLESVEPQKCLRRTYLRPLLEIDKLADQSGAPNGGSV